MKTESKRADFTVDVVGETCPIPLVEMRKAVMKAGKGQIIEVMGTHGASKEEIPMAVESMGLALLGIEEDEAGRWHIFIQK
jgi:tRNA 2-thiouridine synthesizing protein A